MTFPSEYHVHVRRYFPSSVALLGVALLLRASAGIAQSNGAPSAGILPGGRPMTGAVISPTGPVIPPTGSVRPPTGAVPTVNPGRHFPNSQVTFSEGRPRDGEGHRHRRSHDGYAHGDFAVPFLYAVPVPYAVDPGDADNSADDDDDANYQGGPTVFDRRGAGAESYVEPVADSEANYTQNTRAATIAEPPQPHTVLVFKDGHTVELGNYAIVGATLFDLTPGHQRKIAVADIDLPATQRQNDDRGVTFSLPAPPEAD